MQTIKLFFLVLLMLTSQLSFSREQMELKLTNLKCEYLINPLGIDVTSPRLSWKIEAVSNSVYNQKQKAYQILVASSPDKLSEEKADLWNSGKIQSDANAQLPYQGKQLTSEQRCYWKVKVWNNENDYTPWSDVAFWSMGLLQVTDWKAKWIGDQPDLVQQAYMENLANYDPKNSGQMKNIRPVPPSSPMLRKKFSVKLPVKSALLYVSALGYYEIGLNGAKVGDHVLAPEWTDFNKRVQYQAFDVSQNIRQGENVLTSLLGDGWYLGMLGPTKWHKDYPRRGVYGNDRRLIAQLVINYADGTNQIIGTDDSWKLNAKGYILSADNFLGQCCCEILKRI